MSTLHLHYKTVWTLMKGKAVTQHTAGSQTKLTQPFTLMGFNFTDRPHTQHISAFPEFPLGNINLGKNTACFMFNYSARMDPLAMPAMADGFP